MPQRQNVRRIKSEAVQGDDSWIELRSITVRQAQQLHAAWEGWTDEERVAGMRHVVKEWNWVDDDGKPLPQVPDQPDVILDLTVAEIKFVMEAMTTGDTKN